MANTTITFSLCPKLCCGEGDKVFFMVKDPTILSENTGLVTPTFYLITATITIETVLNCNTSQYTFTYDDSVLVSGTVFTKSSIDRIECYNCNTQYVIESIARL